MSDWDRFRKSAEESVPKDQILGPRRFMVGVLIADRDPDGDLAETDFRWMKAHSKITIARIHDTYMLKEAGADVDLWFEDTVLSPDTPIKNLCTVHGSVVALRAVLKGVRPASSNTAVPKPPLPAVHVATQSPPSAPPTPMPDKDAPISPWKVSSDQARTSIETSARPLQFTRVNSTPLSDVPSSLAPENTPDLSIPPHTAAYHQPPTYVPPYASGMQSARIANASAPAEAGTQAPESHDLEPNAEPGLQSRMPPHMMLKLKQSSPAGSPAPEDPPLSQNFNADEVFDRDASPEVDLEQHTQLLNHHVHEITKQGTVEVLEAGVARSIKILETLQETLLQAAAISADAQQWIDSINTMKEQPNRSRTIIGVVGNTGAGKSSVINALLDEERLVPTNCMRACTSSVTEISWNIDDEPDHKYRAEIEFIDRADWENDLKILMQEFLSEDGTLTREASDPGTDAGIAWAKFHAVYPKIYKDKLANYTVEKLMEKSAVLNILGTTKHIHHSRADLFYIELQGFVDSKEKVIGKKDRDHQKQHKNQMEFWPLIKVVRLYTKSEALSTGAVVVDLPGVHDSNAARAAVAERYIQQCSGLWIVAPITRAVDDKAAKNLMGNAFKRQLKYDGNYSAVTFICSKTDDISATEAVDSLDVDHEFYELEEQLRHYEAQVTNTQDEIASLKDFANDLRTTLDEVEDDIDIWEDLKDRVETETVFAPKSKTNQKRKQSKPKHRSQKRQHIDDDSQVESGSDDANDSRHDSDGVETPQVPLTMLNVEQKIASLKNAKKNARQEKKKTEDLITALKPTIRELKSKIADANAKKLALCIQGRNMYSKTAIQKDFAAGIKELDQEAAVEADEEAFNPDQDLRDYDEVANSLPVFCVSSRAYQKMCGRLKKDEAVPGFQTPEETQVPQLKTHCIKLTQGGRIRACRAFLNSFCSTLTPLFLWASNDGTGPQMTDAKKQEQANYLAKRLVGLHKGLEEAVEVCLGSMTKQLQQQVFARMGQLMRQAIPSAPTIAQSWGRPKEAGGLHWSTYKAVVRRGGVYQSVSAGHRDLNAELLDPIIRQLATRWERAFQQRLPQAFEAYTKNSGDVLHAFHARIEDRARQNGVGLAHMAMLKGSIFNYEQMFQNLNDQLKIRLTEAQRDANREFVPTLANFMMTVYDRCANEYGTGSFIRMKNHMEAFVQLNSPTMFRAATQTVEEALTRVCRDLETEMSNKANEISSLMHRDYMHALVGVQATLEMEKQPQRSLKAEVLAQLKQIDAQFERLAQGDLTDGTGPRTDDDTVAGADMEAEQQLQTETSGEPSATNSSMDHADDSMPTESSPATLQPRNKRRMANDTASSPATRSRNNKRRRAADVAPSPSPRKSARITDTTASSARKATKKRRIADDTDAYAKDAEDDQEL